jgi:hypothetical protein
MRWWLAALAPLYGGMLSGCNLLFVAWGDATTPGPVQSIDVVWAKHPELCTAMIHRDGRKSFLLAGDLDAPDYKPSAGRSNSKVTKSGIAYVHSELHRLDFEDTLSMPPMEGADSEDFEDFTDSIKEAWRSSLFRVNADGSLLCECEFVTRRMWFNLAI